MILRGKTSPRLGWTTALGVFGLAVLLLPLVPSLSPAQPKPNPPKSTQWGVDELDPNGLAEIQALIEKRVVEARAKAKKDADMRRTTETRRGEGRREDIQALRAEIAAKMDTLRVLEHKLHEIEPTKTEVDWGFRRIETPAKSGAGVTIRIEIGIKGSPQEIKAALEKIEKALAEQKKSGTIGSVRIISYDGSGPKLTKSGTTIRLTDPLTPSVVPQPERATRFTDPAGRTPAKAVDPDAPAPKSDPFLAPATQPNRRIDALEKKLDQVLKELEALRKTKTAPKKGTTAPPALTEPRIDPVPASTPPATPTSETRPGASGPNRGR